MSFPVAKSPLMVVSPGPHCNSLSGIDLVGSRDGDPYGWDGWDAMDHTLFRHSPSVLKWILLTRYFEDAEDKELCWILKPLIFPCLWPLTLPQLLPSPTFLLFLKKSSLLTSFPHWIQTLLSNLICTSRLFAATLPCKKRGNPSSTISDYWWQAGKSKKH